MSSALPVSAPSQSDLDSDRWGERLIQELDDALQMLGAAAGTLRADDDPAAALPKGEELTRAIESHSLLAFERLAALYAELQGPHPLEDLVALARSRLAAVATLAEAAVDGHPVLGGWTIEALESYILDDMQPWWEETKEKAEAPVREPADTSRRSRRLARLAQGR